MPNVLTADALRKLGIPREEFSASFEDMMRVGVRRVLGYQTESGGWGWYGPDREDPFMTAIAVRGLSECARLGYPVDAVALRRGRERLRVIAKEDPVDDRRAYAAYALGEPDEAMIARFDELSVWAQALLVLSLPPEREARAVELARKLVPRAGEGRWTSIGWTRREDLSVEATCYAIQALVRAEPGHPLIEAATSWVLDQRQDGRWKSTRDTATAIATLLRTSDPRRLAKAVGGAPVAGAPVMERRISVSLDGERREMRVDLNNPLRSRFETAFESPASGRRRLSIEGADLEFNAEVRFRSRRPEREEARGVRVKVEHDRPLGALRYGDEVTATLTVTADEASEYAMVESPVPAGCEIVRGSGAGVFERFEARYDRALFFLRELGPDGAKLSYRFRCAFSGRFGVPGSWAGLMYDESIHGGSAPLEAAIK